MKIKVPQDISNVDKWEDLRKFVSQTLDQVVDAINGRISFNENVDAALVSVTFPAAGQTVAVKHNLNRVANNYIITKSNAVLVAADGDKPNEIGVTYVQSNDAGTLQLLVF